MGKALSITDIRSTLAITDEAERKAAVKAANLSLRTTVRAAVKAEAKANRQTGLSGAFAYGLNYGEGAESQYASKGAMADDYHVKPPTITKWKNLYLAVFVKGIDPTSDLFMRDLNGSTYCNNGEVSALLADDTSTAADIEAKVRTFVDENGNKVEQDNGGPGTRASAKQVCLNLIATLADKAAKLDKYEEWQTVQAAMFKAAKDVEDGFIAAIAAAEAEALAKQAEAS